MASGVASPSTFKLSEARDSPLSATSGLAEPLSAISGLISPLSAISGLISPLSATSGLISPLSATSGLISPLSATSGLVASALVLLLSSAELSAKLLATDTSSAAAREPTRLTITCSPPSALAKPKYACTASLGVP